MLAGHQGAGDVWERIETEQFEACYKASLDSCVQGFYMGAFYKQLHLTGAFLSIDIILFQVLAAFKGEGLIVHVWGIASC